MVIGLLKIKSERTIKNNPFYGNYKVSNDYTQTIVNEKYVGLVSPKNGIHIMVKSIDDDSLDITIGKYAFTGEREKDYDDDTEFSTSFGFSGHIYEVTVDVRGQLISLDEWYGMGEFEDGNEPDNHYTKKSKGIKWELVDM
jgi:hypothetical protein